MSELIDRSEDKYLTYIVLNKWRWRSVEGKDKPFEKYLLEKKSNIHEEFEIMKDFFIKRPEYAIKFMKSHLRIED